MEWLVYFAIGLGIGIALGWLFRRHAEDEEQTVCQSECGDNVLTATCYTSQADKCLAALGKDCRETKPGRGSGGQVP